MPADGMGIWCVENHGSGTAWGAPARFNGIGVVVDTYVNDGSDTSAQTARLFILVSSPAQGEEVDVNADGSNLKVLPECQMKANRIVTQYSADNPLPSLKILIRYARETLQIFYSLPNEGSDHWTYCTNASNLYLPTGYHVGISAATGELMSGHDVLFFKLFEIDTRRPLSDLPVTEVQFHGGYLPSRNIKPSSFLGDVWT
ncbi:L-type lectin domain-containing protein, partial [Trichostrongylus colubriformis]